MVGGSVGFLLWWESYCVGVVKMVIYLIDDDSWELGCMYEKNNERDKYLLWV